MAPINGISTNTSGVFGGLLANNNDKRKTEENPMSQSMSMNGSIFMAYLGPSLGNPSQGDASASRL